MALRKESDFVRLLHGRTQSLAIGGKHLRVIPDSIGVLNRLRKIDARNNQLDDLPESMSFLNNLEFLHLGTNQFIKLPHVIGELTALKKLVLFSNRKLVDITQLCTRRMGANLEILNLTNCMLRYLPREVSRLMSLKILHLSGNQLQYLPAELCSLIKLRELWLDRNELGELPFMLGRLTSLEKLSVNHNQLVELPESMPRLKRLRILDIACNQVRIFPSDTNTMDLEELHCENNPLLKCSLVKAIQQQEVLALKEIAARYVMRQLTKRDSPVRVGLRQHADLREQLAQSARCAICKQSFLNTWLECVRFVPTDDQGADIGRCTVKTLPQRVLLCSYACFNSHEHDFYGVAFP